jgi:hypothetical protein
MIHFEILNNKHEFEYKKLSYTKIYSYVHPY